MATIAIYKGKKYRLAWSGPTKYGERAKLAYFDGSREFWVNLSTVQVVEDAPRPPKANPADAEYLAEVSEVEAERNHRDEVARRTPPALRVSVMREQILAQRVADRVDGYDRDDLGPSDDF